MNESNAIADIARHEFQVMGTHAELLARTSPDVAAPTFEIVERRLHELSARLTRFDPTSELEQLNDAGGGPVTEVMRELLAHAERANVRTGGRFDVGLGAQLVAAGYDRTFDALDQVEGIERGDVAELDASEAAVLSAPAMRGPSFRLLDDGTVRIAPGTRLDLGGIAKGWAADDACRRLASLLGASCLVNLGGDIAVHVVDGDEPWPIGVAAAREDVTHSIGLAHGGLATSSQDRRVWRAGIDRAHHVIDPRTGVSARTDVLRVTVIHDSCLDAEVWTKALMLVGMEAAIEEAASSGLTAGLFSISGREHWTGMLTSLNAPE